MVFFKPDAMLRGVIGEIISRFERRGLKLVASKMIALDRKFAEKHYAEHVGKPFFDSLVEYVSMSPVLACVIEGENSISIVRSLAGATNPINAQPGSVRGDYGITGRNIYNVIHASDSPESARREVALFFSPSEIFSYEKKWNP